MLSLPSSIYPSLDKANLNNDKTRLLNAWETFMYQDVKSLEKELTVKNQLIRPLVIESWQRCKEYDLNPMNYGTSKNYSMNLTKELCETNKVLSIAKPVLSQLNKELAETGHAIFLTN